MLARVESYPITGACVLQLNPHEGMTMDHNEAVQQMASERYLLDELTPEVRDAFEQHVFDCMECALDLRAGSAFVLEAKAQLPGLAAAPRPQPAPSPSLKPKWWLWSLFTQPAFAVPAFAVMLGVIAYQNIATIPELRSEADGPRVLPWVTVHTGTRSAAHTIVQATPGQGAVLLIDTPQNQAYTSYLFELYDSAHKRLWSQKVTVSHDGANESATMSLFLPASGWKQGTYTLNISGVTPQGESTPIDQRILDIHFDGSNQPGS